jgi:O-antigen/teichoic acid export membrane protein
MKRLSRNLFALLTADIIRRVLGFLAVAYLARVLGTEAFGIVNIGWTTLAYGIALSAAGLPTFAAKRIAAGTGNGLLPGVIGSRIVTAAVVFCCTVILAFLLIHDRVTSLLISVMGMSVLAQSLWVDWYFQGRESLAPVAWARTLSSAVYLAVVIVCVKSRLDILWVAGAAVMGDILAADVMARRLRKEGVAFRIDIRGVTVSTLLRQSIPLSIGAILAYLSINFAPLALGVLRGAADVGIYSAASKLVFFLLVGDRILSTLLLPASARLHAESPEVLARTLREALRWVLIVGLPIAVGGVLLAQPFVSIVFGPLYAEAMPVFQIFVWYFLATMLHTVYTSGVIAAGGERSYGRIMTATAGLYVVTVTAGVLLAGELGAAIGVVVSESVSAALLRRTLGRLITLRRPPRLPAVLAATVGMGFGVYALQGQMIAIPLLAGIALYAILLFAFRGLTADDLRALKGRLL